MTNQQAANQADRAWLWARSSALHPFPPAQGAQTVRQEPAHLVQEPQSAQGWRSCSPAQPSTAQAQECAGHPPGNTQALVLGMPRGCLSLWASLLPPRAGSVT